MSRQRNIIKEQQFTNSEVVPLKHASCWRMVDLPANHKYMLHCRRFPLDLLQLFLEELKQEEAE